MAIDYLESEATFKEVVSIQEVDALMEWLLANPEGTINLKECQHMHLAALQALTYAKCQITEWPDDESLKRWIERLLTKKEG